MHHRARRSVEQLDAGSPVEDARDEVGELAEAVLAPVDLPDRHTLVDDAEDGARVVTRAPQRPGRGGAHLDGVGEPDVERHREGFADARDDPLEREGVVEPRDEQDELVAADRRREARRHDLRQTTGGPSQQAIPHLVTVPVVDVLHAVQVDEHDTAGSSLRSEARFECREAEQPGHDAQMRTAGPRPTLARRATVTSHPLPHVHPDRLVGSSARRPPSE